MNFTVKDLEEMLAKNPALKVTSQMGNALQPKGIQQQAPLSAKPSKYHNTKVYEYEDGFVNNSKTEGGHGLISKVFDSTKEYDRWVELNLLQKAGKISKLTRQASFLLQEKFKYMETNIRAITYKADFCYELNNGTEIVEDVKPFSIEKGKYLTTKEFDLKWKLVKAKYPKKIFLLY